MLRAVNCILIILVLLLTALFGLIALLIMATEQGDGGLLDKLYLGEYQPKNDWNKTRMFASKTTKIFNIKATNSTSQMSTTTQMSTTMQERTEEKPQTTTVYYKNGTDEWTNTTLHKLQPIDLKLRLSNAEKVMTIGMEDGGRFFVAKVNGELEFFNWTTLESIRTEKLDVQIHRLAFLSDGRLVVTEMQTKSLHLLDPDYKIVTQLKLGYQPLDLQVFGDMIYVLSRLNGTIFVYDDKFVQKSKIEWQKENSCNFIRPIPDSVLVSCDNAILKLSNEGKVVGRASVPGSLYSLAVYVSEDEIWAAQRGKEEIHVYNMELQFKYTMSTGSNENAIWSSIGFEDGRVFVLNYVSNEVQFFEIN